MLGLEKSFPLVDFYQSIQEDLSSRPLQQGTYLDLAFAEYLRRDDFLGKFKDMKLFAEEFIGKIKQESFVLLVFGSSVKSSKPRDIDLLLIVDSTDKIAFHEKFLHSIASNYDLPFEERVIGFESVYEMLSKRDEKNIMNEILNKHILLYGAELFYRLIERGRS